jgi:LacI family transcriptional regulator
MAKRKWVMIIHPVGDPQLMPTLRGISDYASQRPQWELQFSPEMLSPGLRQLKGWPGHGIIALLRTRAEVAAARATRLPVVNLSGAVRNPGLARVMVDQEAMGRIAAEHLLGCGLTRFAYYGERDMWYSQQRKCGFLQCLTAAGRDCCVLETTTRFGRNNPWYAWIRPLEKWLRRLPRPVGLLAVHDYAAAVIVHTCARLGLRVPEDVAVLGVGDDRTTCEFCEVSSIARSNREVGYQAAALLDSLMSGKVPPNPEVLVPPKGVVQRRSTEIVAADDPRLLAAIRFAREHVAQPFTVSDLCEAIGVSRRALELSFRDRLRSSPREYIARLRIQQAQKLLAGNPDLKLEKVSRCCGIGSARSLSSLFRQIVGCTPDEYRRRARSDV